MKYTLLISGSTMRYSGKYEWQHILDNYNINVVLLPWYNLTTGEKIRLVELLMRAPEWKLSYSDDESAVFTRIK